MEGEEAQFWDEDRFETFRMPSSIRQNHGGFVVMTWWWMM
jgi:hypothetical protein